MDDPHFKQDMYKTIIKLLNGGKIATMGSGTKEPVATATISAKFTVIECEK